ncbi:TetR/AcrR family transcriptional regulator [Georgenia sp. Marseille-Q6866]
MGSSNNGRDRERTRRAILDVATKLIHDRGIGVSLDVIAADAGISKSGLVHHFAGRDALVRAVALDAVAQFHETVSANVDLAENHPGKLLRAYIRTVMSDTGPTDINYPCLWEQLSLADGIAEILRGHMEQWRADLARDGLHPDRITVVYYAAEGLSANAHWDKSISRDDLTRARDLLTAITNDSGPLATAR